MSVNQAGPGRRVVAFGLTLGLIAGFEFVSAAERPARVVQVAQKAAKKKGGASRKDVPKAEEATAPAATTQGAEAPADGMLSFQRDIAPILVANCLGCHSGNGAGLRNGKLNMTTFDKLMSGGKRGQDIVPGDPEGSHLVQMVKGEETPKMPPNNGQRGFSEEAAAKLETWVKQGATLDAGIARTELISKYAASLNDLRNADLAKMSPQERDKVAEEAGRERWKKASKTEPEVTTGAHFLVLSNLPKARAEKLIKAMESQFTQVNRTLSTGRTPLLGSTEKIGLYVFNDRNTFVEFVRSNENQEVEATENARAKLDVASPYVVACDPLGGGEETTASPSRKGSRKKKGEDSPTTGPERTLPGLMAEPFVAASVNKAGKPPRWISLGLGAFFASQLESGSPYYRRLRAETAENIRIGWKPKANEALGGEANAETSRAIGFSLIECLAANYPAQALVAFIHDMLEGQGKLDEAIGNRLNLMNREEFLNATELWLSEHYGAAR